MLALYPLRLQASLHETLWGGRRLALAGWKQLPAGDNPIGEAWETEINTLVQNGHYAGLTLGAVVTELGVRLLGDQAIALFGERFPLLAKFIDANAQLSVQVHPNDEYAALHEGGKLGKTEFWYILAAEPDAKIIYGFNTLTSCDEIAQAIANSQLEQFLHSEVVQAGDVIFVPAGTVHAIGSGILLYELQEYSDVTYRMYDYGRLSVAGLPRELHVAQSLAVTDYTVPAHVKVRPVSVTETADYTDRCLVACRYFLTRELQLNAQAQIALTTGRSCAIISCLGEEGYISFGEDFTHSERISRGETVVVPAALGDYRITGQGKFLLSYVPEPADRAWQLWQEYNAGAALIK